MKRSWWMILMGALAIAAGPPALAADRTGPDAQSRYGTPLPPDQAAREIRLEPSLRYVNVTHWESVRFVKNGRAFDWKFDSLTTDSFPLAEIAPSNWDVGAVRVYLLHNSYAYPSGR